MLNVTIISRRTEILFISAIAVLGGLIPVFLPRYSAAWVMFWALVALSLPWALSKSFTSRLLIFFCLLAFADFAKRLVFLASDQAGWSQYAVYLFPYLYYFIVLLIPWGWSHLRSLPRSQIWVWGLIAVMLINTWLPTETSITARLAATALLIVPWTMIPIAADHPESAVPVWRALVVIGLLNTLYALWHFLLGPTLIELRWAQATSEFSIGADHLEAFLTNRYGGINVWRPFGFQGDSFTLALFCLNTFAMAWMLREQKRINAHTFYLVSSFLLGGVLLSLVRTVWVAALGMIAYSFLVRHWRWLGRPGATILVMLAAFVVSGLASALLYSWLRWLPSVIGNPILARALTFGTLEARMGSLTAFWESLPRFLLSGYGLAASPWITSKFGGFASLPPNFTEHNVLVEYLWYLGLPGLVLFFAIFYRSMRSVWRTYRSGKVSSSWMALAAAYLLAMFLTGLGNGGVFLNMYFFFIVGILSSLGMKRQGT